MTIPGITFSGGITLLKGITATQTRATLGSNLIINGGFETGDLTGWTNTGDTGYTGVSGGEMLNVAPYDGAKDAYLGPVNSDGILSQTIATIPGDTYRVSFFLTGEGGLPNHFLAYFDGNLILDIESTPGFGWTEYKFDVVASGTSAALEFHYIQVPAYFYLDDVAVRSSTGSLPLVDPATNTGGIDISIIDGVVSGYVYPAITGESTSSDTQWTILSSPPGDVPSGFTFLTTLAFDAWDSAYFTISNNLLTATSVQNSYGTVSTNQSIDVGSKAMFALSLDNWNTGNETSGIGVTSVAAAAQSLTAQNWLGNQTTGIGIYDDGYVWTAVHDSGNSAINAGQPYAAFETNGNIVEVAVDMVNYKMWYRVGGGAWQ